MSEINWKMTSPGVIGMNPGENMRPPSLGMNPGANMSPTGPGMNPGESRQPAVPDMNTNSAANLCAILRQRPHATAVVRGGSEYPEITGRVQFYQMRMGVLIAAEVFGLPAGRGTCESSVFGFHIHSGSTCSGNMQDPFADVMEHYNPDQCIHPQHAGDLPPLFGNNGYAFQVFLTNRFTVWEIIGKTVIIHDMPDDFRSQPGGDAGTKIACGQILGREVK